MGRPESRPMIRWSLFTSGYFLMVKYAFFSHSQRNGWGRALVPPPVLW